MIILINSLLNFNPKLFKKKTETEERKLSLFLIGLFEIIELRFVRIYKFSKKNILYINTFKLIQILNVGIKNFFFFLFVLLFK